MSKLVLSDITDAELCAKLKQVSWKISSGLVFMVVLKLQFTCVIFVCTLC